MNIYEGVLKGFQPDQEILQKQILMLVGQTENFSAHTRIWVEVLKLIYLYLF